MHNQFKPRNIKRILLVEDDVSFREVLQCNLQKVGFQVIIACNGKMAKEFLDQNNVDLVLSEAEVPEIDGFDLLKSIRERSQVPVILMTASSAVIEANKAAVLCANAYLLKPFANEKLLATINHCFDPSLKRASSNEH